MRVSTCVSVRLSRRHHGARGVSFALSYRSACGSLRNKRPGLSGRPPCKGVCVSSLRGTQPAHAARRARAPAASTPHAPGHHSPRRTGARLAQPWTCLWPPRAALHTGARAPLQGLAHGPANHGHKYAPGRKRTNQRHKYAPRGGKDAACSQGHNA